MPRASVATALNDPPYNVVVNSASGDVDDGYHWWVEVVPRTSVVAGFELGTGVLVNVMPPQRAAAELRRAC